MAISLKHAFESAKGDSPDTTLINPSNWNAEHTLLMATAKVLGRITAGTGAIEEIDWTAFGRSVLNAADLAALKVIFGAAFVATADIADDAVTYDKLQNVSATDRLLGRFSSGAGAAEEIALGAGVSISGGTLTTDPNLPRGYIDGCILSNGTDATNDINISAGVCRDSTNAVNIDLSALSGKQLDANWVAGSAAGMRNSAVGIADGTYHIWAGRTAASATADIYAHTSTSAATVLTAWQAETGGSSYAYLRHIGSIVRVSGAIIPFRQVGDEITYSNPSMDVSAAVATTVANSTLTSIPTGLKLMTRLNALISAGSAGVVYIHDPDDTDTAPSNSASPLGTLQTGSGGDQSGAQVMVRTNTSAQVAMRSNGGSQVVKLAPIGFVHPRGKNA